MGNIRKFKNKTKKVAFQDRMTNYLIYKKLEKEDQENYHLYQNPEEGELVLIRFIRIYYLALLNKEYDKARMGIQCSEETQNPLLLLSTHYVNEYVLKKIGIDYQSLKEENKLYVLVDNLSYRTRFLNQPDNFPNLGIPEPLINQIYADEIDIEVKSYLENPQKCTPELEQHLKNKFQKYITPPIKIL